MMSSFFCSVPELCLFSSQEIVIITDKTKIRLVGYNFLMTMCKIEYQYNGFYFPITSWQVQFSRNRLENPNFAVLFTLLDYELDPNFICFRVGSGCFYCQLSKRDGIIWDSIQASDSQCRFRW